MPRRSGGGGGGGEGGGDEAESGPASVGGFLLVSAGAVAVAVASAFSSRLSTAALRTSAIGVGTLIKRVKSDFGSGDLCGQWESNF